MGMWGAAEPTARSYAGACIPLVRFKAVGSIGKPPLPISINSNKGGLANTLFKGKFLRVESQVRAA